MRLPPLSQLAFATFVGVASGYYIFNEPLKQHAQGGIPVVPPSLPAAINAAATNAGASAPPSPPASA